MSYGFAFVAKKSRCKAIIDENRYIPPAVKAVLHDAIDAMSEAGVADDRLILMEGNGHRDTGQNQHQHTLKVQPLTIIE